MTIQALTAYDVPILSKAPFTRRDDALEWAMTEGRHTFPGLKVVQLTTNGKRTIWRDEPEQVAA